MINDPHIQVLDNVFSKNVCDDLIKRFETVATQQAEKVERLSICKGNNCKNCSCLRIDMMQYPEFHNMINPVALYINNFVVPTYKQNAGIKGIQFPSKYNLENLKIKRYMPNTEEGMNLHIDVFDHPSASRFLAFIVYLNDEFYGGETFFPHHGLSVKPKTGRVVVFPPYWPWVHSAEKVTGSNPKYFMGTYLRYQT